MKVTEMKYLAMLLLTETKVNFIFSPDKYLMYMGSWAQHCDETYFLFSDKVKILGF